MRSHLVAGLLLGVLPWTAVALMGLGQQMYYPACGYACLNTLSAFPLSCTTHGHHDMGGDMPDMEMDMSSMATTTPACRAGDRAYLTTLAWCFHTKCADDAVPDWDLEKFWAEQATTDPTVAPKWSYGAALANISRPPTKELAADDTLNVTALVSQDAWTSEYGTMTTMEFVEAWHERYGLIIVLVGFGTPILFTALRHLPYMNRLLDRLNPYFIYPAIWGGRQVRPLPYNLGNAPTVGQALYVAVLVVLNVVMTAVSYRSFQPSVWYADQYQEVMVWVMYRTGVLAFALLPLTLLLAGRNNVLLWLSDWSHATYVLLHRWVARLFALQALLHSLLALVLYDRTGLYAGETSKPWWVWGAVATVAASVMLVASGLYVRRWSYEIFLISHVLLAVFVIVGCWYHIDLRFMRMFGYEQWLYAACAIWFFDRLIRFLRVLKAGVRRAKVTEIGEEFVRVDIEGVRWGTTPGQHAYIYFPTLNPLRPWENHPFSLLPSSILSPPSKHSSSTESASSDAEADHNPEKAIAADPEKMAIAPVTSTTAANKTTTTPAAASVPTPAGITFFIRKSGDLTRRLRSHASLLALLDGPYPNNSTAAALRCDRVLLVAGGIGITGVLPWARSSGHLNTRLCWSVRAEAEHLVDALGPAIEGVPDREVRVGGRRFDVRALVEDEVRAGWRRIGVVVCGPGSLCDEVRAVVAEIGRREACNGVVLELEVDAYSW